LRWLDLSNNQISGALPKEISKLIHLEYVNLEKNQLDTTIETAWKDFPKNTFRLSGGNNIWCPIPDFASVDSYEKLTCSNITLYELYPNTTTTSGQDVLWINASSIPLDAALDCSFGDEPYGIPSKSSARMNDTHIRCNLPNLPVNSATKVYLKFRGQVVSSSFLLLNVWEPKCPEGTYSSLFTQNNSVEWDSLMQRVVSSSNLTCMPCPAGAECPGVLSPPYPKRNFVRSNTQPLTFLPCFVPDTCPGGAGSATACERNFTGPRCVSCLPGLKRFGEKCALCSSTAYASYMSGNSTNSTGDTKDDKMDGEGSQYFTLFLIVLLLVAATVCLFMTRRLHVFSGSGLLIMYIQMLGLLDSYPVKWNYELKGITRGVNRYVVLFDFTELSCDLHQDFFHGVFFTLLSPFMLVGLLAGYFIVAVAFDLLRHRNRRDEWVDQVTRRLDHSIAAFILFLNLSHKSLTRKSLDFFVCDQDPDRRFLSSHPAIDCDSQDYQIMAPLLMGCGILYGIGIPLLFFSIGFRNQNKFHRLAIQRRYGVIFKENRRGAWPFTIYKTMWGLGFVSLSFLVSDERLLVALSHMLLQLNVLLVLYIKPLRFTHNNYVWVMVLETLSIVLYVGYANHTMQETTPSWDTINIAVVGLCVFTAIVCVHGLVFEAMHSSYPTLSSAAIIKHIVTSDLFKWIFPKRLDNEEELRKFHSTFALLGPDKEEENKAADSVFKSYEINSYLDVSSRSAL
jgi:hypothetical protein